ncbi:O-acetyltransferase [Alteromonas sp. KUL42]|uniref:CatB-related O-acetyltransferase n=1 Tax=Alteromonas sp. KUL42 TaxID=2480797 RepID=UPI001036EAEE|nr:CatB-related O-acetyltransferase [Alteromonas sp. KUL42]TAP35594.1 CatB-related O-acetyltransferase [Alteromonas sp. KUL42]GEA07072.1 O-acetyltransferase [Alteromonas sp. KUL42]
MKFSIAYLYAKFIKKTRGTSLYNSTIHSTSKVEPGSQMVNVRMDRHSFCGYNCDMSNVDIGSFCSIANGVIIGGGMHPIEWISTSPVFYYGRDSVKAKFSEHQRVAPLQSVVGNDVWIGQNVIVKQGVTIGTGAVIGMGSIVTKDVPPYAIVAGNPAKILRMRFKPELIERLLASKWWTLDDKKLSDLGQYATDPEKFLEQMK